jgi:hypothetical protein
LSGSALLLPLCVAVLLLDPGGCFGGSVFSLLRCLWSCLFWGCVPVVELSSCNPNFHSFPILLNGRTHATFQKKKVEAAALQGGGGGDSATVRSGSKRATIVSRVRLRWRERCLLNGSGFDWPDLNCGLG